MLRALVLLALLSTGALAQEFTTLKGHGGPIMDLAMGHDGRLASASFDNSVGVWEDQTPLWLEGHDAAVVTVSYDLWPSVLSGGDDFRVLLWYQRPSGALYPLEVSRHQGKVASIALSLRSDTIASAGWDGAINLTRITPAPSVTDWPPMSFDTDILRGHRSNVTDVGFDAIGNLYSTSSDGTIRKWSEVGENRVILSHGFGINELVVTQDWIAYGAVDGGTRIVTHEGVELHDFTLDRRPILAMAYHAATHQLAIGDGEGYIMLIDTRDWRIARDFRAMRFGPVWALAFSNDGKVIHAGGIDDVIYAWPVALLDTFDPAGGETRSFLRDVSSMPNGERQFMRKCSICHALEPGPSRKAGPSLHGVFGRRAGTLEGYSYSGTLDGSDIIWSDATIDALFDIGPDHYIPGSKMPMQVIAKPSDRTDLITFLKRATTTE